MNIVGFRPPAITIARGMVLRFVLILAPTILILGAACGSDEVAVSGENSTSPEATTESSPTILEPERTFTIDELVAAGWKKSKQYPTETIPGALEIWLGFFNQKDVEVRFYASHEDALTMGVGPAQEATERLPQKGGGVKGAGTFAITAYPAYLVAGNTVMLCEVSVETCTDFVEAVVGP